MKDIRSSGFRNKTTGTTDLKKRVVPAKNKDTFAVSNYSENNTCCFGMQSIIILMFVKVQALFYIGRSRKIEIA